MESFTEFLIYWLESYVAEGMSKELMGRIQYEIEKFSNDDESEIEVGDLPFWVAVEYTLKTILEKRGGDGE